MRISVRGGVLVSRGCALVCIRKKKAPNARLAVCICVCARVHVCECARAHVCVCGCLVCVCVLRSRFGVDQKRFSAKNAMGHNARWSPGRSPDKLNSDVPSARAHRSAGAESDVSHGYSSNLNQICISVRTHTCVCVCMNVFVSLCDTVDSRSSRNKMSLFVMVISVI